jgi:hypothetical protein
MKTLLPAFLFFSLFANVTIAQVSINTDATPPDPSAMLDVKSAAKGILIPRMTLAERDAIVTPATGLMIYQTDNTPGFYYNSGLPGSPAWTIIGGGAQAAAGASQATAVPLQPPILSAPPMMFPCRSGSTT